MSKVSITDYKLSTKLDALWTQNDQSFIQKSVETSESKVNSVFMVLARLSKNFVHRYVHPVFLKIELISKDILFLFSCLIFQIGDMEACITALTTIFMALLFEFLALLFERALIQEISKLS